ncbi:TPA: hypothetical protein HA265_02585 [Candidatus Woesearchaeota archaeon]|nr:hypothetical protein [Candidatus Woesearchaeota archaeon]
MHIPKRYGESRITNCPFCGKQATTTSKEGVPVCTAHKTALLPPLKCLCGGSVAPMSGKWGLYFDCLKCGNVNAKRILDNNLIFDYSKRQEQKESKDQKKQYMQSPPKKTFQPKEITITTDDVDYF